MNDRFGIVLPGTNLRQNIELAQYADRSGVDSVWVIETRLATDAIGPMAVYASATDRIKLGSGIIPMWTRNPALIAQSFATLDILAPGRIILGLGAWWEPLATRTGVKRRKVIRAMREVVESVRRLLSMEGPVTYSGEYVYMEDLYLDHGGTEPHDVKVYLAAVGPQMLRLAGRVADGVVLNAFHPVSAVENAVGEIQKGAESVGRSMSEIDRVMLLPIEVTDNKKQVLQQAKPLLAQYVAQQPHIQEPTGIDPELAGRLKELIPWPATEQQYVEGAKLIPDDLVELLGCYGDADEVRARLRSYIDAGVTMPIASNASRETIDFLCRGF